MAVGSLEKETAKDESLKNLYQGINMTRNSLLKAFAKHGLVPVIPEGEKFDPNLHEAVFEVPKEQVFQDSI
jgi:molecular chaperone GrpE